MSTSINEGCGHVTTNLKTIREFITHLISELKYDRKILKDAFKSYLEEMKKIVYGYGNPQNKIGIKNESYRKLDKMYYRLMKVLQTIPQLISEDYDYLMSIGSGLCYFYKKIENIIDRIRATNLIDTVERYQVSKQLMTQLQSALFRYNKLATNYNIEIKRIDVMKSYLTRGIIMYSSNISKKKYSLFIDIEVNKFVTYTEKDKVSQLQNFLIQTLMKQASQNMKTLGKNSTITPIPLRSLDDLKIPPEQFTHPGSLY